MTDTSKVPEVAFRRIAASQARFMAAIDGLDDGDVLRPSLPPGWTVGHVLSHVARNADSTSAGPIFG